MKRSSNIELLRIIAMIGIMLSHMMAYGLPAEAYQISSDFNKLFIGTVHGGGDLGVGIFFLITGYFLTGKKEVRSPGIFIGQVYFYGILSTAIAIVLSWTEITKIEMLTLAAQALIPLFGTWWFVAVYFILVFLSLPMNLIMDRAGAKVYGIICIVGIWYSIGLVLHSAYYPLLRGIFYYMVGACIRKRNISHKRINCIVIFTLSWSAYTVLAMVTEGHGGMESMRLMGQGIRFLQFTVISPIAAVSLFLIFRTIEIESKRFINRISAASFAVYLFHEAPYNRSFLWKQLFSPVRMIQSVWMPVYCIGTCIGIYVVVMMIEIARNKCVVGINKLRIVVVKHFCNICG